MTDSRRERVKTVLLEVLNLDAERRRELLDREDLTVREEVERLLRLSAEMGDFLAIPAVESEQVLETADLIGAVLESRYRVEGTLGVGGFGTVYRAHDERLDRAVAIKVLHRGVLSETALRTEIRALATIDHSGVVGILDAGRIQDGRFFLVTRYIAGKTLAELLSERQKIAAPLVHRWALQLTEALAEAHRKGVLHRDIKPENIMIEHPAASESRAVILDFGIGELLASTESHYVSAGSADRPGDRTTDDWQALSRVLFYALTGATFNESTFDRIANPTWRRFFETTLKTDTTQLQTADEFRKALPGLTRRLSQRRAFLIAGGALLSVALILLPSKRDTLEFPLPVPLTTFPGWERFPSLSPDGARVFFTWAQTSREAPLYVLRTGQSEPVRLTSGVGRDTRLACSPDGRTLAFIRGSQDGRVTLMTIPTSGGAEAEIAKGYYSSLDWTPDGCCLLLSVGDSGDSPKRLRMIDLRLRSWNTLTLPPKESLGDSDPALSPDGRMLSFIRHPSHATAQLYLASFDAQGKLVSKTRLLSNTYSDMRSPQWTPDGRSVLFLAGTRTNRSLWSVDLNKAQQENRVIEAGDHLDTLTVARSAWRVVFSRDQDDTNIWRADLARPKGLVRKKRPVIASTFDDEEVAVSPDGKMLAYVSHRTGGEQIWLSSLDGSNERQLTAIKETDDLQAFWDPHGRGVWVTGNLDRSLSSRFIRLTEGQTNTSIPFRTVGVSNDGDSLYVLVDRDGGRAACRLPLRGSTPEVVANGAIVRVVDSSDGTSVYLAFRDGGIVRVPLQHGTPEKILDGVDRRAFAVGRTGIYFVRRGNPSVIEYYSTLTRTSRELLRLDRSPGFGFAVAPDEKAIFYAQLDHEGADLLLMDTVKRKKF